VSRMDGITSLQNVEFEKFESLNAEEEEEEELNECERAGVALMRALLRHTADVDVQWGSCKALVALIRDCSLLRQVLCVYYMTRTCVCVCVHLCGCVRVCV